MVPVKSHALFCSKRQILMDDFVNIWILGINQIRRDISEKYDEDPYLFSNPELWDEYEMICSLEQELENDTLNEQSPILPLLHSLVEDYFD